MPSTSDTTRQPWKLGRLIGPKPPFKPKHVWAIRTRLQHECRTRDLALFNTAIDRKLRGCDLTGLHAQTAGQFQRHPCTMVRFGGRPMLRLPTLALAVTASLALLASPVEARGRRGGGGGGFCNVCGCKGGPGYRAPDGKCVGHRNITKLCGSPPSKRCKKES